MLLLTSGILPADEQRAVESSINAYYHGADVDQWRDIFESPGRELFDQRHEIVQALGLRPGLDIADVGAGTGLFTLLFARAVEPEGRVYAVDISKSFIDAIAARAAEARVDNVIPVINTQRGVALAPDTVDLVFLADTYHHLEFPTAMLASIHDALRPGGELVIIDFRRIPGRSNPWIIGHVRAGREAVIAEVESAGFALFDQPRMLRQNYFLRFRRSAR
jgi:predicted methyltransferase